MRQDEVTHANLEQDKNLSQKRNERGDSVVPTQYESSRDEVDRGANPRKPAVLRLVVKEKQRVEVQTRAQQPRQRTNNQRECSALWPMPAVPRKELERTLKAGKFAERTVSKNTEGEAINSPDQEGTEPNGRTEQQKNEEKQTTERQKERHDTHRNGDRRGQKQIKEEKEKGRSDKTRELRPHRPITNQTKEPGHRRNPCHH